MFRIATANPPITNWRGKRVWIIGASAGIGLTVAKTLEQQGAILTLSARHLAAIEQDPLLSQFACLSLDISNAESIRSSLLSLIEPLDVIMVFAGAYHAGALVSHSQESIQQTLDTNLTGVINLCHQLLPKLIAQQQAHIVLVGSSAAYLPLPNASVYGASKAGLRYFAQSLYTECLPHQIAVSLVSPGFVKTRLTDQNPFAMPSLMTTEQASHALLAGLAKGQFDIAFPFGFTLGLKLVNALPWSLRQLMLNRLTQQEN